ncbi:hypothetical protein JCM10207_005392 [Rhodosporidiobolus poonsookiae]
MSFFFKLITGAAVGGGLTLYYHQDIERTTTKLQADLKNLSQQLVHTAPQPSSSDSPLSRPVIPQRLPFTEELKARWNEQLGSALYSLQTTDYAALFAQTYSKLSSAVASASQQAAPAGPATAAPETAAGKVEEKQV